MFQNRTIAKYLQMLIRFFSTLFLFATIFARSEAQKHADCASAFDVCKKQTYTFDKVEGIGKHTIEAEMVPCFLNSDKDGDAELNSTWVKFEIAKGGSLGFTITPNDPIDDYDFVVYRLPSNGNCEAKQIVRCMASGDPDHIYSACMGATGLRTGEFDSSEDAGCTDENDNAWLAPLKTATGEKYVILISNVTKSGPGFSINFSGSAKLPCEIEKEKPSKEVAKAEPKKNQDKPPVKLAPEPEAQAVVIKESVMPINKQAPSTLSNRTVDVKKDAITVNSHKIRVTIWDDGIEDGDIVSVFVNEEKVLNKIALKKKARIFDFTLPKGEREHYFTIYSDSFGKLEPNTATLRIEDGTNSTIVKLTSTRSNQQSVKIVVE
jgi:hypothetical protein